MNSVLLSKEELRKGGWGVLSSISVHAWNCATALTIACFPIQSALFSLLLFLAAAEIICFQFLRHPLGLLISITGSVFPLLDVPSPHSLPTLSPSPLAKAITWLWELNCAIQCGHRCWDTELPFSCQAWGLSIHLQSLVCSKGLIQAPSGGIFLRTTQSPNTRASIFLSILKQWENMAHMGLHTGSTRDHIYGWGLASLIKELSCKELSSLDQRPWPPPLCGCCWRALNKPLISLGYRQTAC